MNTSLLIENLQEHHDNNTQANYKWYWFVAITSYNIDEDKGIIKSLLFEKGIDKKEYDQLQSFMTKNSIEYLPSLGNGKTNIPDDLFEPERFKVMFFPVLVNGATF